jgi:hypothetical protein
LVSGLEGKGDFMAKKEKYRNITIDYDKKTGAITVDPDPAKLFWVTGPDAARWKVKGKPDGAASVDIEFENQRSPFKDSGLDLETGNPGLIGNGNTQVKGSFKYSVVYRDADGNEVARVDPGLQNGDTPP